MGMGIPRLKIKIVLESSPLKSPMLARRLGVLRSRPANDATQGAGYWMIILECCVPGLKGSKTKLCSKMCQSLFGLNSMQETCVCET